MNRSPARIYRNENRAAFTPPPETVPFHPLFEDDLKGLPSWDLWTMEIAIRSALALFAFVSFADAAIVHTDPSDWDNHAYPHTMEAISGDALYVLVFGGTSVMMLAWGAFLRYVRKDSWSSVTRELLRTFAVGSLSFLATSAVTEVLKTLGGRLRPDFLSRCFGTSDRTKWPFAILAEIPSLPVCINSPTSHIIQSGRRSFPSGHTSLTASVAWWWGLYTHRLLSPLRNRVGALGLVALLIGPSLTAAIGVTRVVDRRHHPSDVIAGFVIGTIIALLCYEWYFPIRWRPKRDLLSTKLPTSAL